MRPQSAAPVPALCRGLSFSNLTFSKEFTKSGFLFVGKVRGDKLRVQALEFSNHPVHNGMRRHEEERRRPRLNLVAYLLDEVVVNAEVGKRAAYCPARRSNRKTQQRDEEDQTDEEAPEGAANSACARRADRLSCLRPFAALRPSDHSRVHQFNQLLLLQALQNPERLVSAVSAIEFQY